MDDDTDKQVLVLNEMVKTLTIGLESAVVLINIWDQVSIEKREKMVNNLNAIVAKSKEFLLRETNTTLTY